MKGKGIYGDDYVDREKRFMEVMQVLLHHKVNATIRHEAGGVKVRACFVF